MGSSPTPGSRIIVRWQRGRLHRSAKPKAQAHAGPNPARTSRVRVLADVRVPRDGSTAERGVELMPQRE